LKQYKLWLCLQSTSFDRKTGNRILQRRWQYSHNTFRYFRSIDINPIRKFLYASDISRYTRPSSVLSAFAGGNRTVYHQPCARRYWSPLAWKFRINMGRQPQSRINFVPSTATTRTNDHAIFSFDLLPLCFDRLACIEVNNKIRQERTA